MKRILLVLFSLLLLAGCDNKKEQLLTDFSGVWETIGASYEFDLEAKSMRMLVPAMGYDKTVKIDIAEVDPDEGVIAFKTETIGNRGSTVTWQLQRDWIEEGKRFNLVLIMPDGTKVKLNYGGEIES